MRLIAVYQIQTGRRVKISEEVMNALGWSEGDHVVQLLDEKRT